MSRSVAHPFSSRSPVLLAGLLTGLLTLGGCVSLDGSPGGAYGHRAAPPFGGTPPGQGYSDIQQHAIADGCRMRYSGNTDKLRRCLRGDDSLEGKALRDGCHARYSGNPKKLRRCLDDGW